MSTFDDLSFLPENFSGKARLFPLPNLVLFPHVMQPLHIFEPRYRDLLEDALAGDRLVAMAVLAPGWEKTYEGRPPLYRWPASAGSRPMSAWPTGPTMCCCWACSGRGWCGNCSRCIVSARPKSSCARINIRLVPWPVRRPCEQQLHDRLLEFLPMLPEAQEQLDQLLGSDVPLGVLTDVVSYMLDIELAEKQLLLAEVDVYRRTELLLAHLAEATAKLAAGRTEVGFPPEFSVN